MSRVNTDMKPEDECGQWERIAGEFAEVGKYYQAANQYKHAAQCYLDRVLEMTKRSAENYHIYAEASLEKDDHKSAATGYFEAASQYRQISEYATALTLFENAAREALHENLIEMAAQSYLWAAYACHMLDNSEYFLTCAENMGDLYQKAADLAMEEGKAERAVINLSLSAMGYATINKIETAKEAIEKAQKIIDKTTWEWLRVLLKFSEALSNHDLDEAVFMLRDFKEEETIQQVMRACLDIVTERERAKKRT